jgi:ATP-dependent protease HslVU (ClpYQ) peptidase subunit
MTCIIAWTNGEKTIMASDSAVMVDEDKIEELKEPKFQTLRSKHNPDMLIGISGRFKSLQAISHLQTIDIPKDAYDDPLLFLITSFLPLLKEVLNQEGLLIEDEETQETLHESRFLVAYRGQLFEIGSEFIVSQYAGCFRAIGSGADYAMTAMKTMEKICPQTEPEVLIRTGMEMAILYSSSVRGPIKMATISSKKESIDITMPNKKKTKKKKASPKPNNKSICPVPKKRPID